MSTSALVLDPEKQAQAKTYARLRRRLFLVEMALSGCITLAWLLSGWATALQNWLLTLTTNDWLLVAGFGAIFYLSFEVLGLPLAYYTGFVLPHRYGQSNQALLGWISDLFLSLGLTALIGLPVLEAVYWLLRVTGDAWWVWAALGYIGFSVVLSNLAPVLIMPLFNKFIPLGEEYAELTARLKTLAERAGTNLSGVFRFDMSKRTKAANAALTGLGRTRRIILGDTLLTEFTMDEVETVIAHELGHHVNRDIPLYLLLGSLLGGAGLYLAHWVLTWGVERFNFTRPADIAALPLLTLTAGVFGLVTLPLNNALSRWRERLADRYALTATRKPQAFASAMTRLANQNLADADPEAWVVWLFYSHPPIRERLALAEHFSG